MIEFYAPWCPACKQLTPVYKELADYSRELRVKFADCDITKSHALSGRFLITALPTLFVCEDAVCRKYEGKRDLNTLHEYLQDEQWRLVEPLAWWRYLFIHVFFSSFCVCGYICTPVSTFFE